MMSPSPRMPRIFKFLYHLPSHMNENNWNQIALPSSSDKAAAALAVTRHFHGSDKPDEVIILVKARPKSRIRKFVCREREPGRYHAERLDLSEEAKRHQKRLKDKETYETPLDHNVDYTAKV